MSEQCPEGETKRYGKCVPLDEANALTDLGPDLSGGCSTSSRPAPGTSLILILLALLAIAARRRRLSCS